MNILVACEESQEVCKAFRDKGHTAFSCDIIDPSGDHPEWHIKGDVTALLNGKPDKNGKKVITFTTMDGKTHTVTDRWDMVIAFPPCTNLATSGARWFEEKRKDGRQQASIAFFKLFTELDCDKVAIENPVGIMSSEYRKPNQIIQPWMFGDPYVKSTCLWLKGLPCLVPDVTEPPEIEYVEWIDKHGKKKRQAKWYFESLALDKEQRAKVRSKTFHGVALAMANQWG